MRNKIPLLNTNTHYNFADKWRYITRNREYYYLLIPGIIFFVLFKYLPMYGILIAFKDYSIGKGIWGSEWIGLENFRTFFEHPYAWRLIRNTILINFYSILFGFPAPIILASLFNELKNVLFKRVTQTISYLPHFISVVVIAGMIVNFLSPSNGIINHILVKFFGFDYPVYFMGDPAWFRTIYVASGIWQGVGWGTIIYLAAISGVNPELYEVARIDGANRWQQYWNITFPSILPVAVIMFILRIGRIMTVGFQKIILLYNELLYETADVIGTYVYRQGLLQANYSYATAINLFQAVLGFILVILANKLSNKVTNEGLW